MRVLCGLLFLLMTANLWAQREPCLTGTDAQGCGIKIAMDPPLSVAEGNTLWVPNAITVEVPMRLRPSKVELHSAPESIENINEAKLVAESSHYKKGGGVARFQLALASCPGPQDAYAFKIVSGSLPYPLTVSYPSIVCKPRGSK